MYVEPSDSLLLHFRETYQLQ